MALFRVFLLVFLGTSSLPVMASLPPTDTTLLELLNPAAQQRQPMTYTYSDLLEPTPEDLLDLADSTDPEDTISSAKIIAPAAIKRRKEEMEEILHRIYDGLLAVEKGREKSMQPPPTPQPTPRRPEPQPSTGGRGPANHFVRIGRSERMLTFSGINGHGGSSPDSLRTLSATRPYSGYFHPRYKRSGLQKRNDTTSDQKLSTATTTGTGDDDSRQKRSPFPSKRRDRFLRFGRGYSPRSRYMRYGRSSIPPHAGDDSLPSLASDTAESDSIFLPDCGYLFADPSLHRERRGQENSQTGEEEDEEEEEEERARFTNPLSKFSGRSFVPIGRLPSSAFLQGDIVRDGGSGIPLGSLERQRDPGYRLTRAAMVRLGKRLFC